MRIGLRRWMVAACVLAAVMPVSAADPERFATGENGVAATVHPLATQVAIETMRKGGNAVDAAVAAGLMLGVVDGFNSGIGGGCFILIRRANGEMEAIDGREMAPQAAGRDMFLREGEAVPMLSKTGPLAAGVPGALAAYAMAAREFGTKPLSDLILPAAEVAGKGFTVSEGYASRLRSVAAFLRQFPAARAAFLKADGNPYQPGESLVQKDLARTYRMIAREGTAFFYEGEFARRAAAWMRAHGGLMTEEDFRIYTPKKRRPVITTYRGHSIAGFPPPSSGGIHVAQILNILENFDLATRSEEERAHLIAEAMKRAFADRAHWLGDADFAKVPRGLLDKGYAMALAAGIRADKATPVTGHGAPPGADTDFFGGTGKHTTHFCVADAAGNWVAITATINTTFGSKVVIPGTGVVLNNEMDDFSIQPGVPNAFGLIGAAANAVAPGKRPLSSMSPTIVLRDGEPVFSVGAAGGPTIISQAVLAIVNRLDLGRDMAHCLDPPRIHHQWAPDTLRVEKRASDSMVAALEKRGHKVQHTGGLGVSQAMGRTRSGRLAAVSDPRTRGAAAGF